MDKQKEKKKKVLMPFGLRNKLIAAISMLLVSSIMMVSSTYAWFTLSTAPEVKNISTTVAGNGSLEIALMPTDGLLSSITAGAVGSTASLKQKNVKWGNQVDLSDAAYGLNDISLNPAQLNYAKAEEGAAEAAFVPDKPLAIAKYGFDGRIAGLSAENIGVRSKSADGDKFTAAEFGVRAIGELGKDAEANTVKSAYGYVVDLAMRVNTTGTNGAKGKLLLQTEKANRIYDGSTNEETMGGGSTMSFSVPTDANLKAGALKELLGAIRITFVQNYGKSTLGDGETIKILGTAKLDTSSLKDYTNGKNVDELTAQDDVTKLVVTTEGTADIYLYKTETTADGTTETKLVDNDAVLINEMEKNKAYQISAIVWLDGTAVKNGNVSATAAQSLTGTLNLQFSTDIKLNPAVNTPLKGE